MHRDVDRRRRDRRRCPRTKYDLRLKAILVRQQFDRLLCLELSAVALAAVCAGEVFGDALGGCHCRFFDVEELGRLSCKLVCRGFMTISAVQRLEPKNLVAGISTQSTGP